MKKVKVYYNGLTIYEDRVVIESDCPFEELGESWADDYANDRIDNMEWDCYAIPELCNLPCEISHKSLCKPIM